MDAYWNAKGEVPLYTLHTVDLIAIVLTPSINDLSSENGMKQVIAILDKLKSYWSEHPIEALERGAELVANKEKIVAMVVRKAIKEGMNLDTAMSTLDKVMQSILPVEND